MKMPLSHKMIQLFFTLVFIGSIYPILWTMMNSLKTDAELYDHPFGLPAMPRWSNYADAWVTGHVGRYFANSLIVSVTSVLLTLILATWAAFFISRFEFKGKTFVLFLFTLGMLIPIHATLVPLFVEMRTFHLLNTRFTLVFPYVAFNLPVAIFLLVSFLNAFSRELEEAVIMDGGGVMTIFGKVTLPILRPVLVTVTLVTFLNNWNEYSFALVLINDSALKTLPQGIAGFSERYNGNYTLQMAAITIVLLPTILVFVSMQNYLTQGMAAGAVKG